MFVGSEEAPGSAPRPANVHPVPQMSPFVWEMINGTVVQ